MKRLYLIAVVFLTIMLLLSGCGEKVVATVNGEKITENELNSRINQVAAMYGYDLESEEGKQLVGFLKEQILQSLIEERIVLQAASDKKISINNDDVKKELDKVKEQFASDQEYQDFLKERKFTEANLKTYIKNQLILNKLFEEVTNDITDTTKDIKAYYDNNKPEFYVDEQVKASNIVVKTEEEAKGIIDRLDNGEDFGALAEELSIDPTAKQNKGDIGYFDKNASLVEEFKKAAFELKTGQYTKEPVQTMYGYHIIKVEDRKVAKQRTFEEVEQELKERFIFEEKNEKFSMYIDELLDKAEIEKNLSDDKEQENTGSNSETNKENNTETNNQNSK